MRPMRRRFALFAPAAFAAASGLGAMQSASGASTPAVDLPVDFGAHPASRIEWWYVTGALDAVDGRTFGFQITFFRAETGIESARESRFRADQLVFAHAAVTDLAGRRLRHDQRIARAGFGIAEAATGRTNVVLRDWRLADITTTTGARRYRAVASSGSAGFAFDLALHASREPLPQGDAGLSRKGPDPEQTSRYYSEPQLVASGTLGLDGKAPFAVAGRAWLDHEWSDSLLDASAVGWDWIGMNLNDGSALTAFRLRRADGSALWAGGSFRSATGDARSFGPDEVVFTPVRRWTSAASKATYPVRWQVTTPAGAWTVDALLDDQELDALASTGAVYWEGLSALLDANGRSVGRGYLEMTGYANRLVL